MNSGRVYVSACTERESGHPGNFSLLNYLSCLNSKCSSLEIVTFVSQAVERNTGTLDSPLPSHWIE